MANALHQYLLTHMGIFMEESLWKSHCPRKQFIYLLPTNSYPFRQRNRTSRPPLWNLGLPLASLIVGHLPSAGVANFTSILKTTVISIKILIKVKFLFIFISLHDVYSPIPFRLLDCDNFKTVEQRTCASAGTSGVYPGFLPTDRGNGFFDN